MSGFNDFPGQEPEIRDPDRHLTGFEAEPLPTGADPGRTLGVVGFVLAIFFSVIGLVVSIIAYNTSKKAGFGNGWAVAGMIVGGLAFAVTLVLGMFAIIGLYPAASNTGY
ncbi:DUF4190 domain-containing protein [Luethyella okanaganae]|uniref:DUF4190 domain-containing protein n=1 Tax=Luethyella okanaganae TaxID=69372 RepID=A0ABW1VHV1_9MICO